MNQRRLWDKASPERVALVERAMGRKLEAEKPGDRERFWRQFDGREVPIVATPGGRPASPHRGEARR
jgi:hypothetical protein